MGFRRGALILKFTGEFDGLEIKIKRLPIGDLLAVSKLADLGKDLANAATDSFDALLGALASNIISWNMEYEDRDEVIAIERGTPSHVEHVDGEDIYFPSTGMYALDINLVVKIVDVWVTEAAGVTEEMGKSSMSGNLPSLKPSEEFQLMDAILQSQESSPEHAQS